MSSEGFKSYGCTDFMEKEEVLKWWTEYIGELFNNNRGSNITTKIINGPKISEMKAALRKMKQNKAAGLDEFVIETLTGGIRIEKLKDM